VKTGKFYMSFRYWCTRLC